MAGKGGGAWKVAYADFVTAMMAFFMVMWLVGQDAEKKQAVAEYFQDPWAKTMMNSKKSRKPSLSKPKSGMTDPRSNSVEAIHVKYRTRTPNRLTGNSRSW